MKATAHPVKHRASGQWRVIRDGLPIALDGRYNWPTKAEATKAAAEIERRLMVPCPACGRNVISIAMGYDYIEGKPALLCPCGTWVTQN
jgi:hypothetical protein